MESLPQNKWCQIFFFFKDPKAEVFFCLKYVRHDMMLDIGLHGHYIFCHWAIFLLVRKQSTIHAYTYFFFLTPYSN